MKLSEALTPPTTRHWPGLCESSPCCLLALIALHTLLSTLCFPLQFNRHCDSHRSKVIVPWPGLREDLATSAFSIECAELCCRFRALFPPVLLDLVPVFSFPSCCDSYSSHVCQVSGPFIPEPFRLLNLLPIYLCCLHLLPTQPCV